MEVLQVYEGHRSPVYALSAGPVTRTFLSGSGDGVVAQWSLGSEAKGMALATVDEAVFSVLYMPHHRMLVVGTEGGALHVIDLRDKQEKHCFRGVHHRGVFDLVAVDDDRFACAGGDGSLSIWRMSATGVRCRLERQIPLCEEKLRGLAVGQGGRLVAVACGDGRIRVLDTHLFNENVTLEGHPEGALAVAFHPTKPVLVSSGKDGHLRSWMLNGNNRQLLALPAHRSAIYRIAFRSDGALLASAGRDKAVKLWDGRNLDPMWRHESRSGGHTHSVNAVLWMDDLLLSAGDDRVIRAFSTRSYQNG